MNTWRNMKSELWKVLRRYTWRSLLKAVFGYRGIKLRELDDQYSYKELV